MAKRWSTCRDDKTKVWLNNSSILGKFFVILIPKCPICIMAYTSAITMCGGADVYYTQNNWVSYIPPVLSLVVTALILINRRGRVTFAAVLLSIAGSLIIILTHQLIIPSAWYNAGTLLLILAIWLNGSFSSFVSSVQKLFSNLSATWQK